MALTITFKPGYTFYVGEVVTEAKLNLLIGGATVYLDGSIGTVSIGDGTVTGAKLATGAVSDASKIADAIITDTQIAVNYRKASLVAACRNLVVKNHSGSETSKLDVTADEVVLKNSAGGAYLASAVNVTVDITVSGAGGLDTGSEASDTWYYVWLIYNPTGNTVAALLSTSSSAPSLPANYTHYALVGVIRNDGSSNFVTMWQNDRRIWVKDQNVFTAKGAAVSNTYQNLSGGDLTNFQKIVPPIAKSFSGTAGVSSANAAFIAVAGDSNGTGETTIVVGLNGSSLSLNSFFSSGRFECSLMSSQNFYWKSLGTSATNRIDVSGFTI